MRKIKILHIVSGLDMGGVAVTICNYYKHMDHDKIQFDFITPTPSGGYIETELKKMGCRVYNIPPRRKNLFGHIMSLNSILGEGFDCIHVHQNFHSLLPLFIGKNNGIKNRIVHSHEYIKNPKLYQNIKKSIIGPLVKKCATSYFACGVGAAKWLYGERFFSNNEIYIMRNGIEVSKYIYSQSNREETRRTLKISDEFLIGHVGRFTYEKNHKFIIDVCKKLNDYNINFKMILIGDGPLMTEVRKQISKLKLEDFIILTGKTNKVNQYLSAMDLFILPSLFEAFPISLIEAQINGLKTIVSDVIPDENYFTESVEDLPLGKGPDIWANRIKELQQEDYSHCKNLNYDNFNIARLADNLSEYYRKMILIEG